MEFDLNIRFAAVFDRYGAIKEKAQRDDISPMLDEYATQHMLREAASSWHHRKNLANELGKAHYSMTEYDKLIRITMPLSTDSFLLVSHGKLDGQSPVVKQIQQVLDSNKIDS